MNRDRLRIAFGIVLAAGVALFVFGYFHTRMNPAPLWMYAAKGQMAVLIMGTVAAGVILRWIAGTRLKAAWGIVLFAILLLSAGLAPVAAILLMVAAAASLGHKILSESLLLELSAAGAIALASLTGFGVIAFLISLSSHFKVNYPPSYAAVLLLCIAVNWRGVLSLAQRLWRETRTAQPPRTYNYLIFLALVTLLLVHFSYVCHPQIEYDSLEQHLYVPASLATYHQWNYDAGVDIDAVSPLGGEWLFGTAYMFGGETAAQLVNFLLFGIGLALLWEISKDLLAPAKRMILLVVVCSLPLAFYENAALYLENGVTAAILGALLLATMRRERPTPGHAIGFGILLGLALQIKLLALFALPVLIVIWYLYQARDHGPRNAVMATLAAGIAAFVVALPPYAYAWAATGNPVLPFYNAVFKSPFFPDKNWVDARRSAGFNWRFLYDLTFHTSRYAVGDDGAAGYQFILLLPAGFLASLFKGDRTRWAVAAVVLFYGLLLLTIHQSLRYLYPVMPLATLLCVMTVELPFGETWKWAALTLCEVAAVMNFFYFPAAHWMLKEFSLDPIFSPEARTDLLKHHAPTRLLAPLLQADVEERPRVLLVGHPFGAGIPDPLYLAWYDPRLLAELAQAKSETELFDRLRERRVTHVILAREGDANLPIDVPIDEKDVDFGLPKRLEQVLTKHATLLTETGRAQLYRMDPASLYTRELLKNGEFHQGLAGWESARGQAKRGSSGLILEPGASIAQSLRLDRVQGTNLYAAVAVRCLADNGGVFVRLWWEQGGRGFEYEDAFIECNPGAANDWSTVWAAPEKADSLTLNLDAMERGAVTIDRASLRQ